MSRLTVLMTAYDGTAVDDLRRSVESVLGQTRPPDEFLVVIDGPVRAALEVAVDELDATHDVIRVDRLPRNLGSGPASQHGLQLATGDVVARQDSDDISLPHRLERELAVLAENDLDIVGSAMFEFEHDPENIVALRRAPLDHDAIATRLRINNPVNNPTMMFRRSLALDVGGYQDVPYHEDYDLVARMIARGARAANLADPLVLFNAGDGMLSRRSGLQMLRHEWLMQRRLREAGIIGPVLAARNLLLRGTFRLLPDRALRAAYGLLFRRHPLSVGDSTDSARTTPLVSPVRQTPGDEGPGPDADAPTSSEHGGVRRR